MLRLIPWCVVLSVGVATVCAEEPKVTVRPISDADSVIAVYREDHGRASGGGPAMILAAWPDGHVVWSADRVKGGAPYRAGRVDPKKLTALLARFDNDGLFADDRLNQAHFGPDSQFITVYIKTGKSQVKMRSWHELFEESDKRVVDHRGVATLEGRRRLDVLREAPAEYLFFRSVWSETRGRLNDLVPAESTASAGKPVMKSGVLTWEEPASK